MGAREHYAIPRALHSRGQLAALVTDAWVQPGSFFGRMKRTLRERYHPALQAADVRSMNNGLLAFELGARMRGLAGWDRVMARNQWFQKQTVRTVEKLKAETHGAGGEAFNPQPSTFNSPPTFFAYSYAALEIFRWAKAKGWRTVLGQIDPGREMGRIMAELEATSGTREPLTMNRSAAVSAALLGRTPEASEDAGAPSDSGERSYSPPEVYWNLWREECALADRIVVNSAWSRDCLVREKIPGERIAVVPLAYEPPATAREFKRAAPETFTPARPLRLLFLGQVSFLKGIIPLLEAMEQLHEAPVELTVVGPELCEIPVPLHSLPNVRWTGAVARGATAEFYRQADVFVFPSFCDGFGLTQLEAQAWQLPVIASRNCGAVVQDDVNGVLLNEVSGAVIAGVLQELASNPGCVRRLSAGAHVDSKFSLDALATALVSL